MSKAAATIEAPAASAPTGGTFDINAEKILDTWTREQRIEWAVAKYGVDAPYVWFVYRVGDRNQRSKVDEIDGLNVEDYEGALVQRHGGGRFFRQLRIRGNPRVPGIVSEDFQLADVLGTRPMPAAGAAGAGAPPTVGTWEDRIARIEKALDRFAGGMPAASAPDSTTAQMQAMWQMSMQMAQMMSGASRPPTPVEELVKIKTLAEQLVASKDKARRHDDDEERDGPLSDYREIGHMILGVIKGIGEALPRQQQQQRPALVQAPGNTIGARPSNTTPPAPTPAPAPHPAAATPAPAAVEPAPSFLREPFPGCFDIVEEIQRNPAIVPVAVGRDPADECEELIRMMFQKIENAAGDPELVARNLGARGIVESFVTVYPDAAPFRDMMERAAHVFVEAATAPPDDDELDDEEDGDASAALSTPRAGGKKE